MQFELRKSEILHERIFENDGFCGLKIKQETANSKIHFLPLSPKFFLPFPEVPPPPNFFNQAL